MEMVKQTNISETEVNTMYLWRYIDLGKLLDFIINKQMHFSRLDQFDDPLEGLDNQTRHNLMLHNTTDDKNILSFFKLKSREELNKWQQGVYASCWFMPNEDVESLAMWNLYSNANGFAIRVKLKNIIDSFMKGISDFQMDSELSEYYFGKVDYMGYWVTNDKAMLENRLLTSMIKSPGYEHEREFRFLLLRKNFDRSIPNRISLKVKLEDSVFADLKIIANPEMDNLSYEFLKEKLSGDNLNLEKSKIITKKIVNRLIS